MNTTAKKSIIILSFVAVLALSFALVKPVQAQTATQIIIQNLQRQIAILEQQLYNLEHGTSTVATWCYTFNDNLGVGSTGTDVVNLQMALNKQGLYGNSQTGIYDEQLAAAVTAFQEKYSAQILTPNGLSYGTGYVGPSTRAELNALYGCSVTINNGNIFISGVSGPTSIGVNQTGTWTVNASDTNGNSLSYSVNWGDGFYPLYSQFNQNQFYQSATFSHTYSAQGTYLITFNVRDNAGNTATTSINVVVGSSTIQSPTANAQTLNVNENSSNNAITLTGSDPQSLALTYSVQSSPAHGTLSGTAPNLMYTPATNYTGSDSFTFMVNNGTLNSSTATVMINVNSTGTNNNDIVINGVSGPTTLGINQTGTWTVNATDPDDTLWYSVNWGDNSVMPLAATMQTATFTHAYSAQGTYTVTFTVRDNEGSTQTASISVYVQN